MLQRRNQDVLSAHYNKLIDRSDDDDRTSSSPDDDDRCADSIDGSEDDDGVRKFGAARWSRLSSDSDSDDDSDEEDAGAGRAAKNARRTGGVPELEVPAKKRKERKKKQKAGEQTLTGANLLGVGDSTGSRSGSRKPYGDSDSDGEFLTVRRTNHELSGAIDGIKVVPTSAPSHKRVLREREKARSKMPAPEKIVFDDEGNTTRVHALLDERAFRATVDVERAKQDFLAAERVRMKQEDVADKAVAKQKLREKRLERKERARRKEAGSASDGEGGGMVVTLDGGSGDEVGPDTGHRLDLDSGDEHGAPEQPLRRGGYKRGRDELSHNSELDDEMPEIKRLAMDEQLALRLLSGNA